MDLILCKIKWPKILIQLMIARRTSPITRRQALDPNYRIYLTSIPMLVKPKAPNIESKENLSNNKKRLIVRQKLLRAARNSNIQQHWNPMILGLIVETSIKL